MKEPVLHHEAELAEVLAGAHPRPDRHLGEPLEDAKVISRLQLDEALDRQRNEDPRHRQLAAKEGSTMISARFGWVLLLVFWTAGALAAESSRQAPDGGLVNPGYHEQPAWFKTSFLDMREDVAEAAAAHKRLVLYFYQDGCPYCKKLLEVNFAQRDIVQKMRANFDVVAINMWGDREVTDLAGRGTTEKAFAQDLKVMFTPTLLFLDEKGNVVLRTNGYYPPHKFRTVLNYVAGHMESRMSYRDYYAKVDPEPAKGELHQDPAYRKPPYRLDERGDGRPLLVLFEQKDCSACDELHLDILKRPESRKLLSEFDVVLLDMWSRTPVRTPSGVQTDAAGWARTLKIQYAPSMIFFDTEGREVFRAEGYLKAFHTQSVLDYVASGAYRKQPNFQRYIDSRADRLRAQGMQIDLMK